MGRFLEDGMAGWEEEPGDDDTPCSYPPQFLMCGLSHRTGTSINEETISVHSFIGIGWRSLLYSLYLFFFFFPSSFLCVFVSKPYMMSLGNASVSLNLEKENGEGRENRGKGKKRRDTTNLAFASSMMQRSHRSNERRYSRNREPPLGGIFG